MVQNILQLEGKPSGSEFVFSCPVHDDRRPSCSINTETGLWQCFSCGAAGDLVRLVAIVKGVDSRTAFRLVEPHTPEGMLAVLKKNINAFTRRAAKKKTELPLYPPNPMDYLYARGFTPETCERYGCGYVERETFDRKGRVYTIQNYIALPVRDSAGNLMSYCYRNTSNAEPRYLYTPDASLASLWYGAHLYPAEPLLVVAEGPLDAMWVSQAGLPAWGLLGANMASDLKLAQLRRHSEVVLFMDRDTPGARATQTIGDKIHQWVPTRVALYPRATRGKDPADLAPDQVRRSVQRAIPYSTWATGSFRSERKGYIRG